jgi:hypothetical protein
MQAVLSDRIVHRDRADQFTFAVYHRTNPHPTQPTQSVLRYEWTANFVRGTSGVARVHHSTRQSSPVLDSPTPEKTTRGGERGLAWIEYHFTGITWEEVKGSRLLEWAWLVWDRGNSYGPRLANFIPGLMGTQTDPASGKEMIWLPPPLPDVWPWTHRRLLGPGAVQLSNEQQLFAAALNAFLCTDKELLQQAAIDQPDS